MAKTIENPIDHYVSNLFAQEDETLQWIQAEADRQELPPISILPDEGRLLQFLMKSVGARKVIEIGALAGYSGVWIARALPHDGKLYSLEHSSKHAQVVRASFQRAGLSQQAEVIEGNAMQSLAKLSKEAPFDFVFIDADKTSYLEYLKWTVDNLRSGGMVAAHNALRGGKVANPQSDDDHAMAKFNQALADEPRLESTIISMGDGMAVGIKK